MRYEHLIGRPFKGVGVQDCFALFREFYADNFEINVRDYARPKDWESDLIDLVRAVYSREGFELITKWKAEDLRPADVLCMTIGQGNANHLALYLGDNQILHHLVGRLSTVEPYRDIYHTFTNFVLRHPDVPDLRPVKPDTDIGSLLRARYS